MEGENRPTPRTPGIRARRPERRARAGEGEATAPEEEEEEDRGVPAARRTYLGSGRPPRTSCRSLGPSSCPFPSLCLLCARTSRSTSARSTRKAMRGKFGPRAWIGLEKLLPGEESDPAAALACAGASPVACGQRLGRGVRSRPPRTSGRSLSQAVAFAPGVGPVAQGSPWVPPLSAPVLASVRRACSPRRKRRSRSFPHSHRPGRHRRSATALCASPEFRQVLGNSSSALFQLPHSHPPPARRLEAGASFSPSPCLAPSLIPTTPPPRGADTPPGGAWARRSRAQPLSLPEPGPARLAGGRGAAAR